MDVFKYAGVSKHNGKMKFRATNRDGYAEILIKEGKTDVNIQSLPNPMDKIAAKGYLITLPEFQTPEILAALGAEDLATQVKGPSIKAVAAVEAAVKAVKGKKAPKGDTVPKGAQVAKVEAEQTPVKTDEEIERIREKNMAVLKKVAKKRKKEVEMAAEVPTVVAHTEDDEDVRDFLPKFLQKGLEATE